ncbi:MAG TPA: DUF6049 family protein [Acidimicrobiales bacterium]|nr:DUF6049 family protein [Acidimicrobiales bacterium]
MKLLVVVAAMLTALAPVPAGAQSRDSTAELILESQTAWVGGGGTFQVRIAEPPPQRVAPVDLEYAVSVHPSSPTRNAFAQTLSARAKTAPLAVLTTPVTEAVADETGAVTLDVGIQDPAQPRDSKRVGLRGAGVYPVAVELRTVGGAVHARLLTHLIFVPTPPTGPRLAVGIVVPIRAPLSLQPNGEDGITARDVTSITAAAQTLARLPAQGIFLAPSPETLAALMRDVDDADELALAALRAIAPTHPVIGAPFVPTHAALAPDADRVASSDRGRAITTAALGAALFTDLAVIDDVADDRISGVLPKRLIVRDTTLQPASVRFTTAEPIAVRRSTTRDTAPALLADAGLSAHLRKGASPVLAAHHLIADLATVYFDSPGLFRSIVVMPSESWRADAAVLGPLIAGLSSSPILEAANADRLFRPASKRTARTRTFLGAPTNTSAPSSLTTLRRTIDSLRDVMSEAPAQMESFDDRLLIAESTLLGPTDRRSYVAKLTSALTAERHKFQLPTGGSVTLTARRGGIPITVRSSANYPAQVLLEVASDRLKFPGGSTRLIQLSRHDTTERFAVQSLGSGAFPLRILLKSPDGRVLLGQTRLTVRSTNASGVGIGLSVGAGIFLVVWWYRHSMRRRRARAA